jgi:hypothetical protein
MCCGKAYPHPMTICSGRPRPAMPASSTTSCFHECVFAQDEACEQTPHNYLLRILVTAEGGLS